MALPLIINSYNFVNFHWNFYETCFKLKNKPVPFFFKKYFFLIFVLFFLKSDLSVLVDLEKF